MLSSIEQIIVDRLGERLAVAFIKALRPKLESLAEEQFNKFHKKLETAIDDILPDPTEGLADSILDIVRNRGK